MRLLVSILSFAPPVLSYLLFTDGDFNRQAGFGPPTLIQPAGWAFSIWGPIFVLGVAFGLYQLRSDADVPAGFRPPMAAAFAATGLWLLVARAGAVGLTVVCMLAIAVSLVLALRALVLHGPLEGVAAWVVGVQASMFAGWVTVATVANLAVALAWAGVTAGGGMGLGAGMLLLATATFVAALIVRWRGGDLTYAATVAWGLVAVAVGAWTRPSGPLVSATAVACTTVLVALQWRATRRPRRP